MNQAAQVFFTCLDSCLSAGLLFFSSKTVQCEGNVVGHTLQDGLGLLVESPGFRRVEQDDADDFLASKQGEGSGATNILGFSQFVPGF